MAMIYLPLFAFLLRNMTKVLPMVIGVMISSSVISIAVMFKKYRETKNPPSLLNCPLKKWIITLSLAK